jgi:ribosomal protein L19E
MGCRAGGGPLSHQRQQHQREEKDRRRAGSARGAEAARMEGETIMWLLLSV